MARWNVTLFAVLCVAVVARLDTNPMVQLDVWADEPVDIRALTLDRTWLDETLDALPEFRVTPAPGRAHAAIDRTGHVLSAVSVTQVAPNRVRIRMTALNPDKGHRVIDAVRQGYVSAGLKERLSLTTTHSGGFFVGLMQAVGIVAALALICEGCAALVRRRRRRRARAAMGAA